MVTNTQDKQIPAGYKQTELGLIPEEWRAEPLKWKIGIAHGFPFESRYFVEHGSYQLTTPGHFYEEGGFRDVGEKQKHYNGPVPSGYLLRPGDLIVAMTEQADGLLGSAAFIPPIDGYLHNQRLGRVKALTPEIDLGFMFYVFNSADYRSKVRETAAGTKVKHTSPEKLLEIRVRLPSLPEQRVIAAALSDVDALIASLDKLIAKKRDLKTAAMQQLLTGERRLPGFSGDWEVSELEELLAYEQPTKYLITDTEYSDNNDTPVLTAGKTFVLGYTSEEAGIFENLPVIVFDDFTTASKYVDFPFKAKSSAMKMLKPRDKDISLRFLFEKMQLIRFPLGDHKRYWISEFQKLEINIPGPEEQSAIASVLSGMDADIAELQARREKTQALKQGMMQQLLTGNIRLI